MINTSIFFSAGVVPAWFVGYALKSKILKMKIFHS